MTSAADRLRKLADEAVGPQSPTLASYVEMAVMAPDLARWAADAAERLEKDMIYVDEDCGEADCPDCKDGRELTALLARLEQITGDAT